MLSGTLVYFNKRYGLRTSGPLFLFWLTLTLFAIPYCRTEVLLLYEEQLADNNNSYDLWAEHNFISFMIYFSMIGLMTVLNCFVDKKPLELKYPKQSV